MKSVLATLLLLYVVALHVSMAGMEVFANLLIIAAFSYQIRERHFKIFWDNRILAWWMAGLVGAVFLSLVTSPLEKSFWYQMGFMRWTIVFWGLVFALQAVWTPNFEKRLLKFWIFALTVAGAYGAFQCLTGVDIIRQRPDILASQGDVYRAVGFFNVSLTYAYVMGMSAFALSLPAYLFGFGRVGLIASGVGLVGMVASTSRGSWVAAVLTIVFYLWFTRRKWVVPAVGAIGVTAMALAYFSSSFASKIIGLAHLNIDHSSALRLDIWRGYWQMFVEHPFFGIGLLEGDKLLPAYYAKLGIQQEFVSHAHNNILQWMAGAGILGSLCYLAVIGIFLVKAWNLRLRNSAWGWSLLCAQVFFHIGGLTEANFIAAIANHFLIFLWALTLVIEAQDQSHAKVTV